MDEKTIEKRQYNPKGKAIFDRIISTLERNGQNRLEMCKYIGIKSQNITNIKYCIPAVDTVIDIAKYLKVSVEYLVTGEDPARPDISGAIKKIEDGLNYLKQVEDIRKAEILVEALKISSDSAIARQYLNGDLDADSVLKTINEDIKPDKPEEHVFKKYGFSHEERDLVFNYRKLSNENKSSVKNIIDNLLPTKEKTKEEASGQ